MYAHIESIKNIQTSFSLEKERRRKERAFSSSVLVYFPREGGTKSKKVLEMEGL